MGDMLRIVALHVVFLGAVDRALAQDSSGALFTTAEGGSSGLNPMSSSQPSFSTIPNGDQIYPIAEDLGSVYSVSSLSSVNCDVARGWVSYVDRKCYKMQTTQMSWNQAKTSCETEGGVLASIHSDTALNLTIQFALRGTQCAIYWIGLNDKFTEAQGTPDHPGWVYEDGSPFDYITWLNLTALDPSAGLPWPTYPANDTFLVNGFYVSVQMDCVAATPLGFTNWPCTGFPPELADYLVEIKEMMNNELIDLVDPVPAEFCALCQRSQSFGASSSSVSLDTEGELPSASTSL